MFRTEEGRQGVCRRTGLKDGGDDACEAYARDGVHGDRAVDVPYASRNGDCIPNLSVSTSKHPHTAQNSHVQNKFSASVTA